MLCLLDLVVVIKENSSLKTQRHYAGNAPKMAAAMGFFNYHHLLASAHKNFGVHHVKDIQMVPCKQSVQVWEFLMLGK